jgi:uncharacterized protein (DUF427 family)
MGCQRVEPPGPGQESVWDYPRSPRLEDSDGRIKLVFGRGTLAYTSHAKRVLETRDPPVYYVPPEDVRMEHLSLAGGTPFCEWKGVARYYDIEAGERKGCQAAWFYPDPVPAYAGLKDYIAFYPSLMDAYWVDGEKVQPQAGSFYGGWITPDIVGPFKGDPDTWGW